METAGRVVNCDKDGHCLHPGTAVGSLYCCRCGAYVGSGHAEWSSGSLSGSFSPPLLRSEGCVR